MTATHTHVRAGRGRARGRALRGGRQNLFAWMKSLSPFR